MNPQFFEKIGIELDDGSPLVDRTKLSKGQHYKDALTQERLKELLSYDPETGVFLRLVSMRGKRAGSIAGTRWSNGYIIIKIDGALYYAHRLAFLYMTGRIPEQVDHKNRDRADNCWNNLRECSQTQNNGNSSLSRRNTSGFRGVRWNAARKKWMAAITRGNKQKHLGCYDHYEDACLAYASAAKEYFGDFYNFAASPQTGNS